MMMMMTMMMLHTGIFNYAGNFTIVYQYPLFKNKS